MALKRSSKKFTKFLQSLVASGDNIAPLFLHPGDDLEILASILNDVPPDSPNRHLADLIERLVTCPPEEQYWKREPEDSIIGPTRYTPAPGSALYTLNEFLVHNPCVLKVEGHQRANGKIEIYPTHIPIPFGMLVGNERLALDLSMDRIMWLLWGLFYQERDLTKLKKCPMCHKWFVDHTKNKSKILCSNRACTNQKWSWEERKKRKAKGAKDAKAKKA